MLTWHTDWIKVNIFKFVNIKLIVNPTGLTVHTPWNQCIILKTLSWRQTVLILYRNSPSPVIPHFIIQAWMIIDRFAFKIIYSNFINRFFFVRFNDSSMIHLFDSQYSINFIYFRFLVFSLYFFFSNESKFCCTGVINETLYSHLSPTPPTHFSFYYLLNKKINNVNTVKFWIVCEHNVNILCLLTIHFMLTKLF